MRRLGRRRRRRRRLRSEDGYAMVIAISTMAILLLMIAAALALALRAITTSTTQRQQTAAFHAADAGINAAIWYSNHLLLSPSIPELFGTSSSQAQDLTCSDVSGSASASWRTFSTSLDATDGSSGGGGWCKAAAAQRTGDGVSTFTFYIHTGLAVNASGSPVSVSTAVAIKRRIVAIGTAGTSTRRVLANISAGLSSGTPTGQFSETLFVECPASFTGSDPSSGCPAPSWPASG